MKIKKKIYLVGTGSGDPDLITLKAYKIILKAEIILYDSLVNKLILNINKFANKIYVGKTRGFKIMSQNKINQLMIYFFKKNKQVIRLKGGDPMIFGRIHEEIFFLKKNHIDCEVIPGISSYSGIIAHNKIPITKRNEIESIIITTGCTTNGKISKDLSFAAQSNATVIIFMGVKNLPKIITEFKKYKPLNYPIAIIQNGTTTLEKSIISKIDDILFLVEKNKISNPAIIILGYAINDFIVDFKHSI